jgi:hypothetical protein
VIELCENVLGFLEKFVSVEHDDSPICRVSGLVLCLNIDQYVMFCFFSEVEL